MSRDGVFVRHAWRRFLETALWSRRPRRGSVVTLEGRFDIMSRDGVFLRQAGLLFLPDRPAEPRPEAPAEP